MVLRKHIPFLSVAAIALCVAVSTNASELVFQGQNAALFPGANPNDTALMMQSVPKPSADTSSAQSISTSSLVLQALQSQVSAQIFNSIFGSSATPTGDANLGGGNLIHWEHDISGNINITFTAPNGTATVITFPDTSR